MSMSCDNPEELSKRLIEHYVPLYVLEIHMPQSGYGRLMGIAWALSAANNGDDVAERALQYNTVQKLLYSAPWGKGQ